MYGHNRHEREDLLQEITVQLWKAFPKYDAHRSFVTWMYRIALNVAIDFHRKRERWTRDFSERDPDDVASAEDNPKAE